MTHPADAMPAEQAYRTAVGLARSGKLHESLAYFERAEMAPRTWWELHHDYSAALHNAALVARTHLGLPGNANRTSFERMAMVRSALTELDRAEPLVSDAAAHAIVLVGRGQTFDTWGLHIDALEQYHRALEVAPSFPPAREVYATAMAKMQRVEAERP